jgi:hypothetical protein
VVVSDFRSLRGDIDFRSLLGRLPPAAKIPFQARIGQAEVDLPPEADALKRDDPRAVVHFFDARKCWRVYYGDFGTIAAAPIALNLRGKFSDCGR